LQFSDLISKFIVLNFPATPKNPAPSWQGKEEFFTPESCARQLLVGTEEDLHSIPDNIKRKASKSENVHLRKNSNTTRTFIRIADEAYKYLLKVSCGLDSQKKGEPHILGQVKKKWQAFEQAYQSRAKKISTIMQAIFNDANKIRTHILNRLKPIDINVAAKDLAGIKGGEKVLVIAEKYGITQNIARALGKECATTVGELVITHPNQQELTDRYQELQIESRDRRIIAPVSSVNFQDLLQRGLEEYDYVFVCQPMNNSELDQQLIAKWKQRSRKDGKLVHLKGNPNFGNATTFPWNNAGLKNFVTPEQIKQFHRECMEEDKRTINHAERACDYCSEQRAKNSKPRVDAILALAS
jgi:glutamyl-tRNA reductase